MTTRVGRRLGGVRRWVAWHAKGLAGKPRVLLVELRWRLGDEIMALPVIESLRRAHPRDHLAVLTNYPDLFLDSSDVDSVNAPPAPPDRHLLLRGAARGRYRPEVYARRAGVPLPPSRPRLHYRDWHTPLLDLLPAHPGPVIVVAAGTTWRTKHWRMDRWRALCRRLHDRGARLVELGIGDDPIGAGLCLVDRSTIRDAACVLRRADLLISCDCGLMHLALAVGTPAVALFGPTDPVFLMRDEPLLTAVRSTLPCAGLWNHAENDYDPETCPHGHANCLEDISVDTVIDAVRARLHWPA
jgi:ADP-heptose:LPS heptosyltransferase